MAFDFSRINTNLAALQALNALNSVNQRLGMRQLRLATGKQINDPSDNSAGYTIATKLGVRAAGLGQALDNIGSVKNLIAVGEGHLSNISDILTQMRIKASEAANDTLGTDERAAILEDLQGSNNQINQEYTQAEWNGVKLLQGTVDFKFQIGAGTTEEISDFNIAKGIWSGGGTGFNSLGLDVVASSTSVDTLATLSSSATITAAFATGGTVASGLNELATGRHTLSVSATTAGSSIQVTVQIGSRSVATIIAGAGTTVTDLDLGVGIKVSLGSIATGETATHEIDYTQGGYMIGTQDEAQTFMQKIDDAIDSVSAGLRYTGAIVSRLTYQEASLTVAKTNTLAAQSRIMDADMAYEQLQATKLQILQQTATAMLAQANVMPQNILTLFR